MIEKEFLTEQLNLFLGGLGLLTLFLIIFLGLHLFRKRTLPWKNKEFIRRFIHLVGGLAMILLSFAFVNTLLGLNMELNALAGTTDTFNYLGLATTVIFILAGASYMFSVAITPVIYIARALMVCGLLFITSHIAYIALLNQRMDLFLDWMQNGLSFAGFLLIFGLVTILIQYLINRASWASNKTKLLNLIVGSSSLLIFSALAKTSDQYMYLFLIMILLSWITFMSAFFTWLAPLSFTTAVKFLHSKD